MITTWRFRSLLLCALGCVALFIAPPPLHAQMTCAQCDPANSGCSESCWFCLYDYPDGGCPPQYVQYTTCGAWANGCIQDGCSPFWQQSSSVNIGTYGEARYGYAGHRVYSCYHHRVDAVTYTDANHCNINPDYWTQTFCNDSIDGYKNESQYYQDCCNGLGETGGTDPTFTCNHVHWCS